MRRFLLLLSLAALGSTSEGATVLFDENFEDAAYIESGALPLDFGQIRHGCWNSLSKSTKMAVVVRTDETRCIELHSPAKSEAVTRAIGRFGVNNTEASPTEEALQLKLSFKMSALLDETLFIQLGGGDGKSKATVGMSPNGRLTVSFAGVREEFGEPIEPGVWYTLEFLMPAKPKTKSLHTVNLYKGDETVPLGSKKGQLSRSIEAGGANYSYFDIQHRVPGASLFIDNIKAVANPEGVER